MNSPTDGRFTILILFLIAVTVVPLAGAQPAPAQDQYFEFQILLDRGGSVTRDSILKAYWSALGLRAESSTSAWLVLPGEKELLSLDSGNKLAIKRPWDSAARSLRAQPPVTFKLAGPSRDQTLGDWKCTTYQLRSESGPNSKRLAMGESEIQIWLAKNSEVEGRRLVELLARMNLGLATVEQVYKMLPENGLLVRYQENHTMPAHTTTINLIAQRRVPHDPTRFTVPKDYRILDSKDQKKPPANREASPIGPPHAG